MSAFKFGSVLVCSVLLLSGCTGGSADQVDVYPVSGKVTLGGSPVAGATVTFSPKGKQPVAVGRTNSNGEYALTTYDANDGAAAGDYFVAVSKTVSAPTEMSDDALHEAMASGGGPPSGHGAGGGAGGGDGEGGSMLPSKYSNAGQSGLSASVTADGENKFDFDLQP